ncbi:MAG: glutamine amidotransferase [Aestuariivita sp.]|nr:glutamine amidotransferase [Aestuariivita sp.]
MGNRVILIRHGHGLNDDRVMNYLIDAGFTPEIRKPFAGEKLEKLTDDIVGTVIYGGIYNASDTELHPFLQEEYRWINDALNANIPVLGLCQGAQMIAHHFDEWTGPRNPAIYEFGYYKITSTGIDPDFMPDSLYVTQYHYHTFDLPKSAILLASSNDYENQAFRIGKNIYGFQFHPEITIEGFRRWQQMAGNDHHKPGSQDISTQNKLMREYDADQALWFYSFLEKFFDHKPATLRTTNMNA